MYVRANELDEDICEAHFNDDEYLRKVLGKVLKGLGDIVEILSDVADTADED